MMSTSSPSSPPPGFSLCENIIPKESWNEIKSFLGLQLDQPNLGIDVPAFGTTRQVPTTTMSSTTQEENNIPWELTPPPQHRPVAQFGYRYDYQKDAVIGPAGEQQGVAVPHIPNIFQRLLLDPLQRKGHDDDDGTSFTTTCMNTTSQNKTFDQCIVNVYYPTKSTPSSSNENSGSHIPWHVDDSHFGPTILVYTFGEARPLHMRNIPKKNDTTTTCIVDMPISLPKLKPKDHKREETLNQQGYYYFSAHPPHGSYYVLSGDARHLWEHSVPSGSDWRVSITFRTLREPILAIEHHHAADE